MKRPAGTAALRAADGATIVVDAVEGVVGQTERAIAHAIEHRCAITLVVNKVDRLIVELKLPPTDARGDRAGIQSGRRRRRGEATAARRGSSAETSRGEDAVEGSAETSVAPAGTSSSSTPSTTRMRRSPRPGRPRGSG